MPVQPELIVEVCLAELNTRRSEISERSKAQQALLALQITAVGAIGSFALGAGDSLLLLLVPVSCALGVLYANHQRTIHHIGKFIDEEIKPAVDAATGGDLLNWERQHPVYRDPMARFMQFGLPIFMIFMGPPLVALLSTVNGIAVGGSPGRATLWICSVVLTVYLGVVLGIAASKTSDRELTQARRAPEQQRVEGGTT